jgi:hypothetical protein
VSTNWSERGQNAANFLARAELQTIDLGHNVTKLQSFYARVSDRTLSQPVSIADSFGLT